MKKLGRRIIITTLFLFQIFANIAKADVTEIKKKNLLIAGVKDSLYPFGFVNETSRELEGYDIDFVKAIANKLGVQFELKPVTSSNRIPLLMEENVDMLACTMTITPDRAKQINFSYPYFISKQKFIVLKGTVKALKNLENKKIGTTKGSTSEINVAKALPNAKILSFDDYPQAFLALQQGKVFAITTDESILAGILSKATNKENYEITSFNISDEPYGIGVNKNNPNLLKVINETLLEMEKSKKASEIFNKWFGKMTVFPIKRDFKIENKSL